MREIEFRIRHREKEWFYGVPLTQIRNGSIGFKSFDNSYYDLFADAETLGQYSEIKDRKGSKIYEGDIVRYCIHTKGCEDLDKNYVVEYSFGGFRLREDLYDEFSDYVDNDSIDWDRCEVVGNIYDNPELIKESE